MKTTMMCLIAASGLACGLSMAVVPAAAQLESTRPVVFEGEKLTYTVRSSRFGNMGTATMRVDADSVDGREAWRLSFDFSTKMLLFKVSDHTRSWIDATSFSTLRYCKTERSPLGSFDEDVRILPELRQWVDAERSYPLASRLPMDELAFIYYVRSAASHVGASGVTVERHFDEARNPVQLTLRGRARIAALGDSLYVNIIQMDARDARQKNGKTRMTFYIGEDSANLPLRIDTSMPMAGTLTMTLQSVEAGTRVGGRSTAMSRIGASSSAPGGQN